MIVHIIGADTRIGYDWTDDDGEPVNVESAVFSIDGDPVELITINVNYPVELHIPDDYAITPGNHSYSLFAVDAANDDRLLLSAGLLRAEVMT